MQLPFLLLIIAALVLAAYTAYLRIARLEDFAKGLHANLTHRVDYVEQMCVDVTDTLVPNLLKRAEEFAGDGVGGGCTAERILKRDGAVPSRAWVAVAAPPSREDGCFDEDLVDSDVKEEEEEAQDTEDVERERFESAGGAGANSALMTSIKEEEESDEEIDFREDEVMACMLSSVANILGNTGERHDERTRTVDGARFLVATTSAFAVAQSAGADVNGGAPTFIFRGALPSVDRMQFEEVRSDDEEVV